MAVDYRREWVKKKVTTIFRLKSDSYFEEMMSNNEDLEDKLASYLDDDFFARDGHKEYFYVFKTSHEKLIDEEILVPQIGKSYWVIINHFDETQCST